MLAYTEHNANLCLPSANSFSIGAVVAMLLPFFYDVAGLLGAVQLFSTTVFLPVQMHIQQAKIPPWSPKWVGLYMLIMVVLCVTIAAAIVDDVKDYQVFSNTGYYYAT